MFDPPADLGGAIQVFAAPSRRFGIADDSTAAYANGLKDTSTLALQFKWRFANTLKL